jgi:hypothetical protein
MMPQQRMSRISMRRLLENDERVLVPIRQIVHRGKLYGDLGVMGQRPRLFYFFDCLEDPMWIFRPHPVALLQEAFCHEVPGTAPKPIVPAARGLFGGSPLQWRGHTAARSRPLGLSAHLNMTA